MRVEVSLAYFAQVHNFIIHYFYSELEQENNIYAKFRIFFNHLIKGDMTRGKGRLRKKKVAKIV